MQAHDSTCFKPPTAPASKKHADTVIQREDCKRPSNHADLEAVRNDDEAGAHFTELYLESATLSKLGKDVSEGSHLIGA